MAGEKPGPAGNRQDTVPLQITVPKAAMDALIQLAGRSPFGATEHVVALNLLATRIYEMQKLGEYGLKVKPE